MAETKIATNNVKTEFGLAHKGGMKPKRLPKGAKKAAKRGLISERQMKKLRGDAGS